MIEQLVYLLCVAWSVGGILLMWTTWPRRNPDLPRRGEFMVMQPSIELRSWTGPPPPPDSGSAVVR